MPDDWRHRLLDRLFAPHSDDNLLSLALWAQLESVLPYCNNPLAAYDHWQGSTPYIRQPLVQCYTSEKDMLDVYVLKFGSDLYGAIARAWQQDAGLQKIYLAINESPWCKGCNDGFYPATLYRAAFGQIPHNAAETAPGAPASLTAIGLPPDVFSPAVVSLDEQRVATIFGAWSHLSRTMGLTVPRQMRRLSNATDRLMGAVGAPPGTKRR